MKQAVILAGGKGTRLKSVLNDLPKPLAEVGGTPLLGHHLKLARRHNFDEVLILVGHGADQIEEWIIQNPVSGLKITCIADGIPKGTAGAVLAIFDRLAKDFLVSYADTMLDVDLDLLYLAHSARKDNSGTLFLHPNDHPFDSDLVELDDDGRIVKFHSYPHPQGEWYPNLVNAALYYLKRDALINWRFPEGPIDFAKDLFPQMLSHNLRLQGYICPEYIKDAGTPERLKKVRTAWNNGVVQRASLKNKQRAVFIDRDGTINEDVGHLSNAEALIVFPFVGPALRRLNDNEWRALVITNQPVLARGDVDPEGMRRIHARLDSEVAKSGAFFDGLFMCPHHPDRGFPGEVLHLKISCDCRKPSPGLIFSARDNLNIDLTNSWFIGDSTRDLGAAEAAGVSSILVSTGSAGLDETYAFEPSFTVKDFEKAVDFILDVYPKIEKIINPITKEIQKGQDWFIGGLARSGKTTLAAALTRDLRKNGIPTFTINLDRWLISEKDRGEGVFGRYELDEIMKVYSETQLRHLGSRTLSLPSYSRRRRERLNLVQSIEFHPDCVLIWEGVIASMLANHYGLNSRCIFVDTDESSRFIRFSDYDHVRGKNFEQSQAAWNSRGLDENPIILSLKQEANYHISLTSAFDE